MPKPAKPRLPKKPPAAWTTCRDPAAVAHAREFHEVTRRWRGGHWGVAERAVLGLVDRYYLLTLGAPTGCTGDAGEADPPGNQWLLPADPLLGRSDMHHGDRIWTARRLHSLVM